MNNEKLHPNRIPFHGTLCRLDLPSDKSPTGARGHLVVLTRKAAEDALWSLESMAVSFKTDWDGHDPRQKCGLITHAFIHDDEDGAHLRVKGFLYGKDFPEVARACKPGSELGMSYELANAKVQDIRAKVWQLTRVTFTGAAILLRDKAAYLSTTFDLSAAAEGFNGTLSFVGTGKVTTGEPR